MARWTKRRSPKSKSFSVVKDGIQTKRPAPPGISERNLEETVGTEPEEPEQRQDNITCREEE